MLTNWLQTLTKVESALRQMNEHFAAIIEDNDEAEGEEESSSTQTASPPKKSPARKAKTPAPPPASSRKSERVSAPASQASASASTGRADSILTQICHKVTTLDLDSVNRKTGSIMIVRLRCLFEPATYCI